MSKQDLHDYNKWLMEVWNPNQLYIPFAQDAPQAFLKYKREQSDVMLLPKIVDGEILEYCCLGFPNDWYDIPNDIKDMKHFEPLKIRIKKPDGKTKIVYNMIK